MIPRPGVLHSGHGLLDWPAHAAAPLRSRPAVYTKANRLHQSKESVMNRQRKIVRSILSGTCKRLHGQSGTVPIFVERSGAKMGLSPSGRLPSDLPHCANMILPRLACLLWPG